MGSLDRKDVLMKKNYSISSDVGYLAAAFSAPRSFQKSMLDRDEIDQGFVTGLTMALSYAIATVLQDTIEIATNEFVSDDDQDTKSHSMIPSMIAAAAGLVMQNAFKQTDNESVYKSGARTLGYWLTLTGAAGAILHGLKNVAGNEEDSPEHPYRADVIILPMGILLALLFDFTKYKKIIRFKDTHIVTSPAKVIGVSAAILGGLSLLSHAEKLIARQTQGIVDKYAKPFSKSWLPFGHVVSLAALFGAMGYGMTKLYHKVESAQDFFEEGFEEAPDNPFVSGGVDSDVDWRSLSVQGRRHIITVNTAQSINKQLNIKNATEPVRVYVGLDSSDTINERIKLVLNEIERTNALAKKYVVLIAPTGSGYVNYVMSDSVELLSKGDCAQITMQYSKRPSPLSLDRVDDGYIQFRILVNEIAKRIRKMPDQDRPTVLMFGESLGAWVSQDAFLSGGTDGLIAAGIDRALWIGTPEMSKWHVHAKVGDRLDMDLSMIGTFDNIAEYHALPANKRKSLRYVMCSHHNDPVANFSASLLIKSPRWLRRGVERPSTLPDSTLFRSPTTFVQTMIDMKNALKPLPGVFTSIGHDYRADLLDFVNEVYGFNADQKTLASINAVLIENDVKRSNF